MIILLFSDCPYLELIGDGFCNDEANSENCNYDGGDCCIDISTDYCIECTCHHEDNCVLGYTPSVVGDGFCNDETNTENCNYDGGDCCGSCVLNKHCTECACLGGADTANVLMGNTVCNDEANIAVCNYDGGDCCGYNVNTDLCSDCKCYVNETCVAGTHPLVGNGFCNDETNNENCNYDSGECCSTCTSRSQCTECTCVGGNDDTWHCKPN